MTKRCHVVTLRTPFPPRVMFLFMSDFPYTVLPANPRFRWIACTFLLLIFSVSWNEAEAQQVGYSTATEYLGAASIIASATRLQQTVGEAPTATTIIDRDLIEALGYKDLSDFFRNVPGMTSAHFTGNKHSINYRGLRDLESRRMQVLVDGRSVYNPMFTGVDWEALPIAIDDIERIEIIRAPNAATYGSNSFLAVVNIITLNPIAALGTSSRFTFGDNGILEGFLRHGFKAGDTAWRVTAGVRHEDTLVDRDINFADGKTVPFLNVRGFTELNESDSLDVQAGFTGGTQDFGDATSPTEPPSKDRIRTGFLQARFRRVFAIGHDFQLHAFRNSHHELRDYLTRPLPLPGFPPPGLVFNPVFDTREVRTEIEAQYRTPVNEQLRLVVGAGLRRDSNTAPQIYGTDKSLSNTVYRLFGTGEWRPRDDLVLHFGAMVENNDFVGTEISPRAAVNWQLHPRHAFRLSYAEASRTPTFREENSNIVFTYQGALLDVQDVASGGLDSEKLKALELGYMGRSEDGRLSWDLKIFHEKYDDIIAEIKPFTPFDPPFGDGVAFDWINQDEATATGAELQLDYRDDKTLLRFTHSEADIDGSDRSERSLVSDSGPARATTLFVQRRFPRNWYAGLSLMRVGKSTPLGSNLQSDSYLRADVRIGRKFRLGNTRGDIRATIENLSNEPIEDHKGGTFVERRGYISVRFDW